MADFRALTLQSDGRHAIQDANRLLVGAGVRSAAGPLSLSSPAGTIDAEDHFVIAANKNLSMAAGTGAIDFSAASGTFKTPTGIATFGGSSNDFANVMNADGGIQRSVAGDLAIGTGGNTNTITLGRTGQRTTVAGRFTMTEGWSTEVADGATAVAHIIDTPTAYTTPGALLLSIRNNGVQKLRFDKDGTLKNDTDVNTGPQVLESTSRMGIKAATEIRLTTPLLQMTNVANIAWDSVSSVWNFGAQTTQFNQSGGVSFKLNGLASGSNESCYELVCQSDANGVGYQAGETITLTTISLQPNVVEAAQRLIVVDNRVALAGDALGQLIDVSGGSNVSGTKITQRLIGGYQEIAEITAPTVAVANALLLFAEDVGGVTKLSYLDSAAVKHSLTSYVPGTSGEALAAGVLVVWDDSGGNPRVFKADANGAGELVNAVGINLAAVGGSGSAVNVQVGGEIAIPDAIWDAVPATGDVGKRVYMSETAGNLTLTAPATPGSTSLKVAVVSQGGAGAVKIIIGFGEPIIV